MRKTNCGQKKPSRTVRVWFLLHSFPPYSSRDIIMSLLFSFLQSIVVDGKVSESSGNCYEEGDLESCDRYADSYEGKAQVINVCEFL